MLDQVLKIINSLNQHNVNYVIIGGYAIILHGYLRATEDLDIMIEFTEKNVKNLQTALKSIYNDDDIDDINLSELGSYPVIRYGTPDNFYIDIISGLGTKFSYSDIEIVRKNIDSISIPFASISSLYEMKKDTYREKDKLDMLFLRERFNND